MECDAVPAAATAADASATDNCDATPVVTYLGETRTNGSCPNSYTLTRTWQAEDACGNKSTKSQTITVTDTKAPVLTVPANTSVECDAVPAAATASDASATDNCDATPVVTYLGETRTNGSCPNSYTLTRTWQAEDACGDKSTKSQTITVTDTKAPTFTRPTDKIIYTDATCNYNANPSATGDVTDEHDNCSTGLNATYTDVVSNGSCAGEKIIKRTWHLADNCGNAAADQVQTITVKDNTPPVVACTSNKTVAANNAGCTYKQTGTSWDATATDNCSSTVIRYTLSGATTSATDAYTSLNNVVFNSGTTTISAHAYDACNNASTPCSFTVTVTNTLTATCSNDNPVLYFGYTLDQTANIKVTPSGGVGPYKVSITMNRPLNCNQVNSSGDEVWTPGANTSSSSNITCPTSGSATMPPVSTSTNTITTASGYSLKVTLDDDADITATITDANGCTTTCTTHIHAEDVRCFAGNSGISKVTICHQTGSSKNPCVTICVDQDAVAEHLAHGDFLGKCTADCKPPAQTSGTSSSCICRNDTAT